jgi:dipeptidyl aminopeptidase/acylaminoacyl peptidase
MIDNHDFKSTVIVLLLIILLSLSTLITCQKSDDRLIHFKGRTLDLKPYVEGFPYQGFRPFYDAGKMYYYKVADTTQLMEISLDEADSVNIDLANGRVVSKIDFAARNVWGMRYRKVDGKLYWNGDERNDEVMNLYQFDPEQDELQKLTDVPYIFGWRWNEEETKIAYVARLGSKDERLGELRILHLETGEETKIIQDTGDMRFYWTSPSWQPDGEGVILSAVANADRNYANLVYVPLQDTVEKAMVLTDPTKPRQSIGAMEKWLNKDEFLFISDESGYRNIYRYNIRTMKMAPVTLYKEDIGATALLDINGEKRLVAVIERPVENELLLLNPFTGKILHRKVVDKNVSILDETANKMLTYTTSASSPFQIDEVVVDETSFAFNERISLPQDLKERIINAKVERVEYPTFDIDPATGKTRMLHAFLYHPKHPLPEDQQLVMITSFYGGGNYFSDQTQILCEAGIYVFSPAPRGSFGFGREFMALNDKDLGGNEIIDIIYAGKYISDRLGIPPERIGVYGSSHGGYATMRLLTFPGEINGITAQFNWGFGVSHAGFSDIIRFYKTCNIPDWVTLEAGDPKTEQEKLLDRSPITHADKLMGKLLLLHGENDSRVPVIESRTMAEKLDSLGKPATYIEFKGQGHGVKGLDNIITRYRAWFDFLSNVGD